MTLTALVVNSESNWQKFVESELANAAYHVRGAPSLESALTQVQEAQYDLVIVGSPLDTTNSIRMLARLVETRPSQRVIIASSQYSPAEAIQVFETGAVGYVEKDLDSNKFKHTLADTLARKPGTPCTSG